MPLQCHYHSTATAAAQQSGRKTYRLAVSWCLRRPLEFTVHDRRLGSLLHLRRRGGTHPHNGLGWRGWCRPCRCRASTRAHERPTARRHCLGSCCLDSHSFRWGRFSAAAFQVLLTAHPPLGRAGALGQPRAADGARTRLLYKTQWDCSGGPLAPGCSTRLEGTVHTSAVCRGHAKAPGAPPPPPPPASADRPDNAVCRVLPTTPASDVGIVTLGPGVADRAIHIGGAGKGGRLRPWQKTLADPPALTHPPPTPPPTALIFRHFVVDLRDRHPCRLVPPMVLSRVPMLFILCFCLLANGAQYSSFCLVADRGSGSDPRRLGHVNPQGRPRAASHRPLLRQPYGDAETGVPAQCEVR